MHEMGMMCRWVLWCVLCCQIKDGYFVHHFSPSSLRHIAKNIVFVVDVSRQHSTLEQVKTTLKDLLDELRPADLFNVVAYSSLLTYWHSRSVVRATSANIVSAKTFITSLATATGSSTNYRVILNIIWIIYSCNQWVQISIPCIVLES